jgi:nitrogenase subunit NifH
MPAYAPGTTGIPLQAIYPGGPGAIVWSAERPLTNAVSIAVVIAGPYDRVVDSVSFEILFAGVPGAFEVDIQEADTDEDAAYIAITNALVSAVNAGNYARYDLSPIKARFVRAFMKTQTANAVNVTRAKFTR